MQHTHQRTLVAHVRTVSHVRAHPASASAPTRSLRSVTRSRRLVRSCHMHGVLGLMSVLGASSCRVLGSRVRAQPLRGCCCCQHLAPAAAKRERIPHQLRPSEEGIAGVNLRIKRNECRNALTSTLLHGHLVSRVVKRCGFLGPGRAHFDFLPLRCQSL